jgi:hypothetical protein
MTKNLFCDHSKMDFPIKLDDQGKLALEYMDDFGWDLNILSAKYVTLFGIYPKVAVVEYEIHDHLNEFRVFGEYHYSPKNITTEGKVIDIIHSLLMFRVDKDYREKINSLASMLVASNNHGSLDECFKQVTGVLRTWQSLDQLDKWKLAKLKLFVIYNGLKMGSITEEDEEDPTPAVWFT